MMRSLTLLILALLCGQPAWGFLGFGENPNDMPPSAQTEAARPLYERALRAEEDGNLRRALRNYKRITKKYPAADFAAQSFYNTGVIQFERKNWNKAFTAFQSILAFHPDFPRFNQLVEYQFRIALAEARGQGTRFLFVLPYRALNKATQHFEVVVRNAPYSPLAPLALMNVALIHQHKGQTAEAIDALDRLINSYPESLLADDAYLSLAETFATLVQGPLYDQGATREAISYFEDFLILFSENQNAAVAEDGLAEMEDVYARSKLVIGRYYYKYRRWYDAAEIFLNEAITIAPESPAAGTAREYLARIEEGRAAREAAREGREDSPSRQKEKSFLRRWFDRILPG